MAVQVGFHKYPCSAKALGPVYTKRQSQSSINDCDDASNAALIEINGNK